MRLFSDTWLVFRRSIGLTVRQPAWLIAGDVVTIGVNGSGELVARLLEQQPFVREAGVVDGAVRLYVDDGEASLPLVLRLLDGQGLAPQSLALHRPSLDDVFLRQTGRSLRDAA